MSAGRTALLRDVFAKVMADPGLQADAAAAKRTLIPLSGEEMAALAARADVIAPEARAPLVAAVKGAL